MTRVSMLVALVMAGTASAAQAYVASLQLEVQAGQVGGSGGSLTDFPIAVILTEDDLRSTANGGRVESAQGWDIIFRGNDSTVCGGPSTCALDHEIESYDPVTGALVAWVRIPSLSKDVNTPFEMLFGDSSIVAPTENPTGVWDANFAGVWHLSEDPSGAGPQMLDSTSSPAHGTSNGAMTSGDLVAGVADGALDFDGGNDYIDLGNPAKLQITGAMTLEAWMRATAPLGNDSIVSKMGGAGARGWDLSTDSDGSLHFRYAPTAATTSDVASWTVQSAGNWFYMAGVFNPSTEEAFYIDSGLDFGQPTANASQNDPAVNIRIGDKPGGSEAFFGVIDEVRISNTPRSADWITTTFNTIKSPSTFLSYAKTVYYSVGTNAADLKSGSPTVDIAGGVATFSASQPDNVGVGDEVTYQDGGTKVAYISGRSSSTVYSVTTATGGTPADVATATVNSIKRAFNDLATAVDTADDGSHLGSNDLPTLKVQLNLACYNDPAADPSAYVRIDNGGLGWPGSWYTGPDHYIRIYTPTSTTEVGATQRHDGTAGSGYRIAPSVAGPADYFNFLLVSNDEGYVRVEGIEIDGSNVTGAENIRGLMINNTGMQDVRISHNLIHDITAVVDDADQTDAIGIRLEAVDDAKVWNNIIYNITTLSTHTSSEAVGIESANNAGSTQYVFNNTIYNLQAYDDVRGIWDRTPSTIDAQNNYVGLLTSTTQTPQCFSGTFLNRNNNVSSDATATGTGSQINQSGYASYFVDSTPATADLHLVNDSYSLWGSAGADLDGNANIPVTDDIDGDPRDTSQPDIGADETEATVNYRSIGTAADYTDGIGVSVTNGSDVVTGSGTTWSTANRGRGDRITIAGVPYTVLAVFSETQLRLTEPYAGTTGSGRAYTIARKFSTLQAWEDCVDNTTACPGVSSSDLIADNRREVGIAYKETAFTSAGGVPIVRINGSITDPFHDITLTADGINRHFGIPGGAGNNVLLDMAAESGSNGVYIQDDFVTVEWLEVSGGAGMDAFEVAGVAAPSQVVVRNNLIHDTANGDGIQLRDADLTADVYNNIIFAAAKAIELNTAVPTSVRILNNTLYDSEDGVFADDRVTGCNGCKFDTVLLQNNIAHTFSSTAAYYVPSNGTTGFATDTSSNNLASDGTGTTHSFAGGGIDNVLYASMNFVSATDLHITSGSAAEDQGVDLSSEFTRDIDAITRSTAWDIGADDILAALAVELVSFTAEPADAAVELAWETGSEIDNLGFHLYRSLSPEGPWERVTDSLIPGLGSSPVGARYGYRDAGLVNGVTYHYQLEDVETTGATARHGPVSATPQAGSAGEGSGDDGTDDEAPAWIAYGDPEATSLQVIAQGSRHVVLELVTGGFYALPGPAGDVRLAVPGFDPTQEVGFPELPVKRYWLDALAGKQVEVTAVRMDEVVSFASLRPVGVGAQELIVENEVVRPTARPVVARATSDLYPQAAQLLEVAFQGDAKKALVELAPLRWDAAGQQLVLARRLRVTVSFAKPEPGERVLGGSRGRKAPQTSAGERDVVARLATQAVGLYGVPFEQVFPGARRAVRATELRLARQGEVTAFHVAPDPDRFGPGSVLYFLSVGRDANEWGTEAVYELERASTGGLRMEVADAAPWGPAQDALWARGEWEEVRYYQAALLEAPDLWLWGRAFAGQAWSTSFELSDLAGGATGRLELWLQGGSDEKADPDHDVLVSVNGVPVAEARWDGKRPHHVQADLHGVLQNGTNLLEVRNTGQTDAAFSAVYVDRFAVGYPRRPVARAGVLEGRADASGRVDGVGLGGGTAMLETGGDAPRWLTGSVLGGAGVSFRVEAGRGYLAVDPAAVQRAEVRPAVPSDLRATTNGAEYLLVGPRAFLAEAEPLLEQRRSQGLSARGVAIEEVFDEFGFGESRPEALRDFLAYAYHEWQGAALRYVVLLGDASFDTQDLIGLGTGNPVPAPLLKSAHLWTASDPYYAAINGSDRLPDVSLGRLPASTPEEARALVAKILAWESAGRGLDGPVVLVADDADGAGDFEASAERVAASLEGRRAVERIYVSQQGRGARTSVAAAFDRGASLMSYSGHGAFSMWAAENLLNSRDVRNLQPQAQQPVVLTMNCLNGYFTPPASDSLSEVLVSAPDKGAIAALSPSGFSLHNEASLYHEALMAELASGRHARLGDAILAAQIAYANQGARPELFGLFHLFGDPALKLR